MSTANPTARTPTTPLMQALSYLEAGYSLLPIEADESKGPMIVGKDSDGKPKRLASLILPDETSRPRSGRKLV